MTFYSVIILIHSLLRWVILILLILAVYNALKKWNSKIEFSKKDKLLNTLVVISAHLQLVVGLSLYIVSPKVSFGAYTMSNSFVRFYTVEHVFAMVLAIVLLTVSNIKSKRNTNSEKAVKNIAIGFTIALILILISIPWSFRNLGAGWI